jgi:hypothetical protein
LEEISKPIDSQARVANNSAHCESVDWIMPRNGEDSLAIGHDNGLALAENAKSSAFQRSNCLKMIDPRKFRYEFGQAIATSTSRVSSS